MGARSHDDRWVVVVCRHRICQNCLSTLIRDVVGFSELYALLTDYAPTDDWLTPDAANEVMTGFCQQATEIIDRTRGLAGSLFCKMIHQ